MAYNQPNILLITTDQQRCDSLSCYGSSFTHTPSIDWLAQEGVLFERAYCANPVCTPARASLFSGLYPSRHGAWNVGLNLSADVEMISHTLANAGYATHSIGKAHFQAFGGYPGESMEPVKDWELLYPVFRGPYYGFQTVELAFGHAIYGLCGHYGAWVREQVDEKKMRAYAQAANGSSYDFGGNAYDWSLPLRLHNSVWTADRTIHFLENRDPSRPFFLSVGFQDPHHPHCVPLDFKNRVEPNQVPLPRYTQGELADKPPHFMAARLGKLEDSVFRGEFQIAGQGAGFDYTQVDVTDALLGRAYYYNLVRLIDQQAGRIFDTLDRLNLAENTIVVFLTDHGDLLGDHGLWMKGPFHYEELVRIPLILRWPAALPKGKRFSGLASQVDLAPTLLDAIGLHSSSDLDGTSLLPAIRGDSPLEQNIAPREGIFVECVDDPNHLRLKTVVTRGRKLTFYHGQSYGELYDLDADPGETRNRWDDPAYAADRQKLMTLILDHSERLEKRSLRYCYA
jgi:arylsulfatase A-like enzyme